MVKRGNRLETCLMPSVVPISYGLRRASWFIARPQPNNPIHTNYH